MVPAALCPVSKAALWCLGAVRADWRVDWGRRGLPKASSRRTN